MLRDDLSANLVHLTRGDTDASAAEAFISIVESRTLIGSHRDIRGSYKCVCFSEAPLAKLATLLAEPEIKKMRYKPFGVMVTKKWLFSVGGRHAIYQPEDEYELLHERQRFRHVRYEPGVVDYTWEREWRVRVDTLTIEPLEATLIVPNRSWEEWAFRRHASAMGPLSMALGGVLPIPPPQWHFVALEDLGVAMPPVEPPPQ